MSLRPVRRRGTALVLAASLVTALAGCGDDTEDAAQARVIEYSNGAGSGNLAEIADALGYLAAFELKRIGDSSGGPESLQQLASGDIDFAMSYNGAIIKVASAGVPITSVITYSGSTEKVGNSILVPEDSSIRGPKDLVGKKVAVNTLGANYEAILDTYLRRGGLTEDEIAKVTLVPLPGVASEGGLREGRVEAGVFGRGARESALAAGGLRTLVSDYELFGDYNIGTVVLADEFIEKHRDVAEEFVEGLAKANDWLAEHTIEEARELLTDYLIERGRDEEVEALRFWVGNGVGTEHGQIQAKDFELPLEWLVAEGEIDPKSFDLEDIWTNDLNPLVEN